MAMGARQADHGGCHTGRRDCSLESSRSRAFAGTFWSVTNTAFRRACYRATMRRRLPRRRSAGTAPHLRPSPSAKRFLSGVVIWPLDFVLVVLVNLFVHGNTSFAWSRRSSSTTSGQSRRHGCTGTKNGQPLRGWQTSSSGSSGKRCARRATLLRGLPLIDDSSMSTVCRAYVERRVIARRQPSHGGSSSTGRY
jgi:hypothetical protein